MSRISFWLFLGCFFMTPLAIADCDGADCCGKMGGIQYCDSSAGRFVCNNGRYSSCYCKRSAVMDMQAFEGCCMWQGGVLKFDELTGLMICNDGGVSELCSLGRPKDKVAAW